MANERIQKWKELKELAKKYNIKLIPYFTSIDTIQNEINRIHRIHLSKFNLKHINEYENRKHLKNYSHNINELPPPTYNEHLKQQQIYNENRPLTQKERYDRQKEELKKQPYIPPIRKFEEIKPKTQKEINAINKLKAKALKITLPFR